MMRWNSLQISVYFLLMRNDAVEFTSNFSLLFAHANDAMEFTSNFSLLYAYVHQNIDSPNWNPVTNTWYCFYLFQRDLTCSA